MKKMVFMALILGVFFYGCSDPTDIKKGDSEEISALKNSCLAGDLESCAKLGAKYALGQDIKKDLSAAKSLFEKSCEGKNPTGCYNLGVINRDKNDYKKALELFNVSCQKDFGQACYSVGLMYKNAEGVDQDLDRSASMFQKACSLNNVYGCLDACAFYKDDAQGDKALPLCERACELDNGVGCFNASDLYFTKHKDIQGTLTYSKRSCDLGIRIACSNVAFLYAEGGTMLKQDIPQAVQYFKKACDLGSEQSCQNYQKLQTHMDTKDSKDVPLNQPRISNKKVEKRN